jgi:DNA-binding NtrC family response regulator
MLHHHWPGNVRQLKNVVEQIALFEGGNTVGLEQLKRYLPQMVTNYSVVHSDAPAGGGSHSYEREREVLFELILRLQKEISELRSEITEQHHSATPHHTAIDTHAADTSLTSSPSPSPLTSSLSPFASSLSSLSSLPPISTITPADDAPGAPGSAPIDVTHTVVSVEGRTLEETEKETIRRSLERNGGRRKATAVELNISERTLYRKIKEFGLE